MLQKLLVSIALSLSLPTRSHHNQRMTWLLGSFLEMAPIYIDGMSENLTWGLSEMSMYLRVLYNQEG